MARGDLHLCGATTLKEYRKYIEKDAALARRFQHILVTEPSVTDTITILRGLKEKYEVHHGCRITDDALVAAALMSERYIADRFLPDKAIDLIDEAASRLKLQQQSKPEAIDNLDHEILTLKIEIQALKKETDEAAQQRLADVQQQLKEKEAEAGRLTAVWERERNDLEQRKEMRIRMDLFKVELEQAKRVGDYERASKLQYGDIPELKEQLQALDADLKRRVVEEPAMVSDAVRASDIAQVVARATGIPVHSMMQSERDKLIHMEGTYD